MRITIAVLLTFLLILFVSAPLLAKGTTTKVTISGVGLKTPIEISDSDIAATFTVWTRTADHGLIIDWSQGPVREPPDTLRRYQVSFYAGAPPNEPSYTWSITRSIPTLAWVMCICPANPMNTTALIRIQFCAEQKESGSSHGPPGSA